MKYTINYLLFLLALLIMPREVRSQFPPLIDLSQASADIQIAGTFSGAPSGDHSGYALCSGDINGDGVLDLVIASYFAAPLGGLRKGEVEIIWGSALQSPGSIDMANDGPQISRIFGKSTDNPLFPRLACGDFNNDGNDDIIYGHPFGLNSFADGMAYVIFGSSSFPDTLDLQSNPSNVVTILGGPWDGSLGRGVCAGDLNGDGFDEIIISAPRIFLGQVYIIHGGTTFLPVYDMSVALPGVTRIIDSIVDNQTGESLASKDIDKDGFDDLLIGSKGATPLTRYGMATLLYGQAPLPDTLSLSDASFRIKNMFGELYIDGRLGERVAIGDVNGDSEEDLILAAPFADPLGCRDCGEIYVLYSANQLPDSTFVGDPNLPITRILGTLDFWDYGIRLGASDLTGDGLSDIVIGSFGDATSPSQLAKVIIVYGKAVLPDSIFLETDTLVSRILDAAVNDGLSKGICLGDFNQDGVTDLALGADFADPPGRSNAGITYLFYGVSIPTGITGGSTPPGFTLLQNRPNPFSRVTRIGYEISHATPVTLSIYNVAGQLVRTIVQGLQPAGSGSVDWNGVDLHGHRVASGVYFYQLRTGVFSQTKKMLLVR